MRKMKSYVSGSISAHLDTDKNEGAFREAAKKLSDLGYETIVPHDIPPLEDWDGNWVAHMRADLIEMLSNADFVVTLPNSESSEGTEIEGWLARKMKMPVIPICNIRAADEMIWPEGSVFIKKMEVSHA